jgi:predicted enzyme related to lactoylglutathione lyase
MANTIVWADIPVTDMDRARAFYGAILQAEIPLMEGADDVALLPWDPEAGGVSADLAKGENLKPSAEGAVVYLDCKGDMGGMLRRVEQAGGKVLTPPSDMGGMVGTISFFLDSEGNRIGLHLPPKM